MFVARNRCCRSQLTASLLAGIVTCAFAASVTAQPASVAKVAGTDTGTFLRAGEPRIESAATDSAFAGVPKLTDLARQLSPTVVNISVEGSAATSGPEDAPADEKSGREEGSSSPMRSLGSGFIVDESGYIVTSNHVIEKASQVVVRLLDDKTDYPATVIGRDPKTDIALLKIEAGKKLPAVFIGDSESLAVGEWVMAIGNQFQLGQTVTAGIVSAKSRRLPSSTSGPYDAFIQTDASINPGSSGGPLFNTHGQVVGINTAIFSPGRSQFGGTGFNIGIGFAIPIDLAREVLTQLKDKGKVVRGLLGVLIQRVDVDMQKVLGLKSPYGALVSDVMPGTPAKAAGFERRDVIVSFGGRPVREHEDLPLMVARTEIGTEVPVELVRDGKSKTLKVTIAEFTDEVRPKRPEAESVDALGLVVETVSEELARALGINPPTGVVVARVEPNSLADRAGLLRGDVIEEFDGKYFKGGDDWREFVKREFAKTPTGERLYLGMVRRREGARFIVVKRVPRGDQGGAAASNGESEK